MLLGPSNTEKVVDKQQLVESVESNTTEESSTPLTANDEVLPSGSSGSFCLPAAGTENTPSKSATSKQKSEYHLSYIELNKGVLNNNNVINIFLH